MKRITVHLISTAIIAFSFIYWVNAQGTQPHKYLPAGNIKKEALSHNITRLNIYQDDKLLSIPIVAIALDSMINLNWWDFSEGKWNYIGSGHEPVTNRSAIETPANITHWRWSPDIGLCSIKEKVFLVTKRWYMGSDGIMIRTFFWNHAAKKLEPLYPDWIRLPIASFGYTKSGSRIWVGSTEKDLIILAQVFKQVENQEVPLLVVFRLREADSANPFDPSSWDRLEIGGGGWEFDGMISGSLLECIYREDRYSFTLPVSLPQHSRDSVTIYISEEQISNYYAPLTRKTINLLTLSVVAQERDIPGGDHPRIQKLNPFYITYDRISAGSFSIKRVDYPIILSTENMNILQRISFLDKRPRVVVNIPENLSIIETKPNFQSKKITTYIVSSSVSEIGKIIIRKKEYGWSSGSLMHYSAGIIPRNLPKTLDIHEIINLDTGNAPSLQYSTFQSSLPVYLTNIQDMPEEKGELIDIVYHRTEYESVFLSRFLVNTSNQDLTPVERGSEVLDINHGQITHWNLQNIQFWRFDTSFKEYGYPDANVTVSKSRKINLDNTIGGGLVVEPGGDRPVFMAYSYLGDGRTRVVFDDELPPSDPDDSKSDKGFDPSIVTGPGSSSDRWLELIFSGWTPSDLPAYYYDSNVSLVSGLDAQLDFLILFCNTLENDSHYITEDMALLIEKTFHLTGGPSNTGASTTFTDPAGNKTNFTYYPEQPYPLHDVTFKAVTEIASQDILHYSWDFGDGSDIVVQTGPLITHAFPYSEEHPDTSYTVNLTIETINSMTIVLEKKVRVQQPLWKTLWQPHSLVQDSLATIGNMSVSFSKYIIDFKTDNGKPVRIEFRRLPKFNTDLRFTENPYGQGFVDIRIPVSFSSDDVTIEGKYARLVSMEDINITIDAIQRFTPGILTREERGSDPYSHGYSRIDVLDNQTEALACKPVDDAYIETRSVDVDLKLTGLGLGLTAIVTILIAIGLVVLACYISTTVATAVATASSSPFGWIVATIIMIGLVIYISFAIPREVEKIIEAKIIENMNDNPDVQRFGYRLLDNSGEGIAEAIAVKAKESVYGHGADATGKNRFGNQFWQMIHVQNNKCRILIRE